MGKPLPLLLFASLLITILLTVSCGGTIESTTKTTELITTPTPTTATATTPSTTNNKTAVCSVIDLILPSNGPADEYFTISVIVTNTGTSQGSCDIPIDIIEIKNPTNTTTYVVNVILDNGETKKFPFNGVNLPEGDYIATAGGISKQLNVT